MTYQARPRGANVGPNYIVYTHVVSPLSSCSFVLLLRYFLLLRLLSSAVDVLSRWSPDWSEPLEETQVIISVCLQKPSSASQPRCLCVFFVKLFHRWRYRWNRCTSEGGIWHTSPETRPVSYWFNFTLPFFFLEIHETYFLSPPSPSTSLHLTFYLPHFAINLLFIVSNELIRVS